MKHLRPHPGWFKRFLFRTYGFIAGAVIVVTIAVAWKGQSVEWQWLGAVLAVSATLVFTVQKQKLDEMALFLSL